MGFKITWNDVVLIFSVTLQQPKKKKKHEANLLNEERTHCLPHLCAGPKVVDSHTVEVTVVMGFVISTVCPLKIKQRANDSRADLCPMGVNYHQWTLSLAAIRSLPASIEWSFPKLWAPILASAATGFLAKEELQPHGWLTRTLYSLHVWSAPFHIILQANNVGEWGRKLCRYSLLKL